MTSSTDVAATGDQEPHDRRTWRDMTPWLGDGGMPLLGRFGVAITTWGRGDGQLGWSSATWTVTEHCCNPAGIVQAGVHTVVLDAAMNFALNAALPVPDRPKATLSISTDLLRPVRSGDTLVVRALVDHTTHRIAYCSGQVEDAGGAAVSRSSATFALSRRSTSPPT